MKKPEIAKRMARQTGGTRGEAADRLDRMVQEILHGLRHGKETRLPGLGCFRPGADGRLAFQREGSKRSV
jgi:nucleoid DNA-binding protein